MKTIIIFVSFMTLSFFCSAQTAEQQFEQQFMDSMYIRLEQCKTALCNYKFVLNYYNNLINDFDSICENSFKYKLLGKSIFESEAKIKQRLDTLNKWSYVLLRQFLFASGNTFVYYYDLKYTDIDLYKYSQYFKDWLIQKRNLADKLNSEFETVAEQDKLLSARVEKIKDKYKFD